MSIGRENWVAAGLIVAAGAGFAVFVAVSGTGGGDGDDVAVPGVETRVSPADDEPAPVTAADGALTSLGELEELRSCVVELRRQVAAHMAESERANAVSVLEQLELDLSGLARLLVGASTWDDLDEQQASEAARLSGRARDCAVWMKAHRHFLSFDVAADEIRTKSAWETFFGGLASGLLERETRARGRVSRIRGY